MENIKFFDLKKHTNCFLFNFDSATEGYTTTTNILLAKQFFAHEKAAEVWAKIVNSQMFKNDNFDRCFITAGKN